MKKYYTLLLLNFIFFLVSCTNQPQELAVEGQICCSIEATSSFAKFASDEQFVSKHEEPEEINFQPQSGKLITFKAEDGKDAKAFLVKSESKSNKYLFMIHEWWGLNDHIKQEAEKYAKNLSGVNVMALDLYDGKVATTREDAGKYMQSTKKDRLEAIIKGAIKLAGNDAKIASIGWCFGGGWSLQIALIAESQAAGCVMYYGMPEKDTERLKTLKTDVLGIFASKDGWINEKVVSEFEENMESAGKNLEVKTYDAQHAFANPSNPKYQKDYADDAFKRSITFIKERL